MCRGRIELGKKKIDPCLQKTISRLKIFKKYEKLQDQLILLFFCIQERCKGVGAIKIPPPIKTHYFSFLMNICKYEFTSVKNKCAGGVLRGVRTKQIDPCLQKTISRLKIFKKFKKITGPANPAFFAFRSVARGWGLYKSTPPPSKHTTFRFL